MNELETQLHRFLGPLFVSAAALIEEDEPALDRVVDGVRLALDRLRWRMIDEVDFYVLEIHTEFVVVQRYIEDRGLWFYKVPYTFDLETYEVEFGEWEQILRVSEFQTLSGEPLEEMSARLQEEARGLGCAVPTNPLLEGWLPEGTSQNDLNDGDFAWVSNKYRKVGKAEKEKMNKREHRKLPFKIHGKVNVDGWKAAWNAVAHGGARALKSYAGGPSKADVLKKLRNAKPKGIKINDDNTIATVEEAPSPGPSPHGRGESGDRTREFGGSLLTVEDRPIVEEMGQDEDGRPYLVYVGTALVDNAISGNRKFYDAESNDHIMAMTNAYMEEGGIVTVYSRHGKAVPGPLGEMPVGLPVGKVVEALWRDGDRIKYKARISATAEGKDVMVLIEDGVMKYTSIRSRYGSYKLVPKKVNGQEVEAVVEAVIHGIDLAEEPGITGAGIDAILAEELTIETIEKQEDTMDLKELTLEALRKERPDLVEELLKDRQLAVELETLKEQATELQGSLQSAEEALGKAKSEHEAALTALTEEKDAKIKELTEERDKGKIEAAISEALEGKEHAGALRRALRYGFVLVEADGEQWIKPPETVAEVAEKVTQAASFVKHLTEELVSEDGDSFKGKMDAQGKGDDEKSQQATGPLTEETMSEIQRLAAG